MRGENHAAMAQGISDPLVWSRLEYAIVKAKYLLEQLGVPTLLTHIDRNITSLNSLVDHIDELYALDLAEKNNDMSTVMTLGLAAVSLILTMIMLPSFWTDVQQVEASNPVLSGIFSPKILNFIGYAGSILGLGLIVFFLVIGYHSIRHIKQIWVVIKRSLKRMGR
jgi:hypothetical protein